MTQKYEKLLLEYPQKEEIPTVLVKLKEKRKAEKKAKETANAKISN